MSKRLKMGMIGGGKGSFIGGVHRMAAALDGQIELVCGAFSSSAERSIESGIELGLERSRIYATYEDMIQEESRLPDDVKMDFVSIVTPNHMHFGPAKMAIDYGFHVVCDKPLSYSLEEALVLQETLRKSPVLFALTHNYTGYPMVKQAKAMIANNELGIIRKVIVGYPQGWLTNFIEADNQKQAAWRTDPTKSGIAGAMGDIGTHAENLAEYITGLKISSMCADISILVEGRQLDDDGSVLLRFDNGAKGILYASQIAAGEENDLHIKVYGTKGGMQWSQMEPNTLVVKWLDKPTQIYRTGVGDLYQAAQQATRIPAGHPEGYLEAFANIYMEVGKAIRDIKSGKDVAEKDYDFPNIEDGVRGMKFIEKVIESGKSDQKWTQLK